MQETENKATVTPAPADPKSEPLIPVSIVQVDETDDGPDEIFIRAVAEIETQPLPRSRIIVRWQDVLQVVFCLSLIVGGVIGTVYGVVNYPKTTVTIFPVKRPVSITTTLSLPTRTLAPVTLTRSASTATAGRGHQDARSATGTVTFYNGSVNTQAVAIGTVFTGNDGIHVSIEQAVTIPAANPPNFGQATVPATTIRTGSTGNIQSYDINATVSSSLFVKNLQAFTGGRDARDFPAVAQQGIQHLTAILQKTLTRAIPQAFQLAPGEALSLTHCLYTFTPSHQPGDEAATITLHASYTCQGNAYNAQELTTRATTVFTASARPAPHYRLFGTVQAHVTSVSPLEATISGTWVYTFSKDYEAALADKIAGETPAQARKVLLRTGVIAQASIPTTLPQAMYINFLVLVEM